MTTCVFAEGTVPVLTFAVSAGSQTPLNTTQYITCSFLQIHFAEWHFVKLTCMFLGLFEEKKHMQARRDDISFASIFPLLI